MEKRIIASNRKAHRDYFVLETYEAGIVLAGYEVKSLRRSQATLTDGLVSFHRNEAYLENVHIAPYEHQSTHVLEYDPRHSRKLLLHKKEIGRLYDRTREKGLTLVPLEMYFTPRGVIKVVIGLAKGKKTIDKRETIQRRETDREIRRELKVRQQSRKIT
ncbi:MAG: SsrA-binding protein [Elusimicrobia bacterium RIFOXYB2_FULL_50_12]|nr:MAG: SsrA-binding protein [Elusimicrobia bacterium RIFOXYB2_FULL_50_12]